MIKKISAIILALVLCLSVMVVPASAAVELGDAQIAIALEWDKEYYNPGDIATLSIYVDAADDLSLYTGAITVGFNSSVISMDENPIDEVKASATTSDVFASYYKTADGNLAWFTTATLLSKLQAANTAEENEKFDTYLKFLVAKNTTGGWHENTGVNNAGFNGSDFDPNEPIVTYQLKISENAPMGAPIEAKVTTGSYSVATAAQNQTSWKYYKTPGSGTTTANITADGFASTATVPATVGEPEVHECTPAEAVQENVVDATCATDGSYDSVVYCSVCKEEISRETVEVKATGEHVYATVVDEKAPTCTEDGYEVKACGCGTRQEEPTVIPATGHTETKVVTRPTCTEAGYTTYTCSVCQNVRKADEVPAKGHDYREKVTAPTCTEAGYTTFTCPFCKDSYTGNEVEATGHNYEPVVTAPTCTEAGYTTYTCSACNDSYTADEVAATGHKYEVSFVKPASCAKAGYTTYTCSVCEDSYKEDIPALDHKNADGSSAIVEIPAVPATCKNVGYTAGEKCEICNTQTVVPQVVPTLEHAWDAGVVTAPTYEAEGYTTYTCTVCQETKKDNFVPKLEQETPDTPDTPDVPETGSKFAIKEPAVIKLRFMDEMLLHTVMPADAPEGAYVEWEAVEGAEFFTIMENEGNGKLRITPKDEGWTTFRATLKDTNGNVLATDEIEMFSRAHLFDKIGGIIRYIFGSNIKYEK